MRASGVAFACLALRCKSRGPVAPQRTVCSAIDAQQQTMTSAHAMPWSILVLDPASSVCLHDLEAAGLKVTAAHNMSDADLQNVLPGYDAVVVRSANRITRSMLTSSPQLAAVGRAGSGVDNIDLQAAAELGVPVVNAPTGNARSVAELVFGLMLGLCRSIPRAHGTMRQGEWAKKTFTGRTLSGKTLGVVGFGSVGQELAKIAIALGMTVVISNPNRPPTQDFQDGNDHAVAKRVAIATAIGVRGPALPLDELLCMSDFVSVHLPLTVNTRCMIAARELALMKPSAVIINAARGGIVDEQALLLALEEGRLGGAGLDVFESEKAPVQDHVVSLCRLPNVICTPHIGGSTQEAGDRVLGEVCDAVVGVLDGSLPPRRVICGNPNTSLRCARLRLELSPSGNPHTLQPDSSL